MDRSADLLVQWALYSLTLVLVGASIGVALERFKGRLWRRKFRHLHSAEGVPYLFGRWELQIRAARDAAKRATHDRTTKRVEL